MNSKKIVKVILFVIAIMVSVNVVFADDCTGLLTQDAADLISDVVNLVRIAVPILLIILCAADFITVVLSQDDNAMKKAGSKIVKRFICAAAVFFVPLIVSVILNIDAIKNSLNLVDDPLCGIDSDTSGTSDDSE